MSGKAGGQAAIRRRRGTRHHTLRFAGDPSCPEGGCHGERSGG